MNISTKSMLRDLLARTSTDIDIFTRNMDLLKNVFNTLKDYKDEITFDEIDELIKELENIEDKLGRFINHDYLYDAYDMKRFVIDTAKQVEQLTDDINQNDDVENSLDWLLDESADIVDDDIKEGMNIYSLESVEIDSSTQGDSIGKQEIFNKFIKEKHSLYFPQTMYLRRCVKLEKDIAVLKKMILSKGEGSIKNPLSVKRHLQKVSSTATRELEINRKLYKNAVKEFEHLSRVNPNIIQNDQDDKKRKTT